MGRPGPAQPQAGPPASAHDKFATQALFSVQVMALGSTNREVNMTAGEVLFLETMLAVSSALLAIYDL